MTSAWLLPEHIADVLPSEARRIEELRRKLLDLARSYGFELVIPPMLEHLESLLSGTGHALDLKTFKLVDQLSGRMLGVRADTTPQVARIDAHLLNRQGVARLCYCGPVLHARPDRPLATREPLQFGAEIYGHAGLEADLEIQDLALDGLAAAGFGRLVLDMGDARIVRSLLATEGRAPEAVADIVAALTLKDRSAVEALVAGCSAPVRDALLLLLDLYGGEEVLDVARRRLPALPGIAAALDDLAWLGRHLRAAHPGIEVGFDLSDMSGYAYYSGVRFSVYAGGSTDALLRGGRYDEVGAVFGRNRPAVGFSLDLRQLSAAMPVAPLRAAIRAPWSEDAALRAAIRALRAANETVVCALPGHEHETQEFDCDRELVAIDNQWTLRPLTTA
ncbi:MAG TPA: ATP phosphoribosyltransferase regulatory subunit [Burkholderiaceae bacterium]|nr:ATP phosphoribosyltransferase regulatory subunit [Burkholderiaceae bacterium]